MPIIPRQIESQLLFAIENSSAVVILGPRQVGKTTVAFHLAKKLGASYLDLESELDRSKLSQATFYLEDHKDHLLIIDEVQRAPGLFPILRGVIDQRRRDGNPNSQFLLLGSASLDVLQQLGETLAGRVSYMELGPINISEIPPNLDDSLWIRGGFPDSLLASNDELSLFWRRNFIRTYLERDIPDFGFRISAETLRRFWGMLCHHQGCPINISQLSQSLGIESRTTSHYLNLLVDLMLVRKLQPWHSNHGKRLAKSPKVYVRDSGIVHALLNIQDKEALLSHPVLGQSWECFVIENILSSSPPDIIPYFYRSSGGAEIDLILYLPGGEIWAIEIKRSSQPKLERGFYSASDDILPHKKYVIYPGNDVYRIAQDIEVMPLRECIERLNQLVI